MRHRDHPWTDLVRRFGHAEHGVMVGDDLDQVAGRDTQRSEIVGVHVGRIGPPLGA